MIKLFKPIYCSFITFTLLFYVQAAHATPQLTNKIQDITNRVVASSTTPGAVVLIASPTLGIITVASGEANKEKHVPMQINHNFRIASMTKTFIATLVLQLSQQHLLNLNDKIIALLPDSIDGKRIPNADKITIKDLLQMRSGIPDYTKEQVYLDLIQAEPQHIWTAEETIKLIYDKKPHFAPNQDYEYSNSNYILLQLIIEKITGTTLSTQLQKHIFDKLHLNNTYFEIQQTKPGGYQGLMTHGYEMHDDQIEDVTNWNDGFGLGDAGIITTALDLYIFIHALFETNELLSPELFKQMLTVNGPEDYGLGIYKEKEPHRTWAWTHNGDSSGFSGQYYYFPDKKLFVIILTNCFDSNIIDTLLGKVLAALPK